jgi:hypothetical protein
MHMPKTPNVALVPHAPLSSADLDQEIAKREAELPELAAKITTLADNDEDALVWTDAHRRLLRLRSMRDAAVEREAREAGDARQKARDAFKPEAMEAVKAADPRVAFKGLLQDWEMGLAYLTSVAKRLPEAMKRFEAAQVRAHQLAPKAGIAYAGPVGVNDGFIRALFYPVMHRHIVDANLTQFEASLLPRVQLATPSAMGRIDASAPSEGA